MQIHFLIVTIGRLIVSGTRLLTIFFCFVLTLSKDAARDAIAFEARLKPRGYFR